MHFGITTAFEILNDIRSSGPDIRDTPVVILAATATNRLFAYQSGADGFVVRPVHADELLDVIQVVLNRSPDERADFRRTQLLGGANTA
jgi:DNA-binding response OmpR family regulator